MPALNKDHPVRSEPTEKAMQNDACCALPCHCMSDQCTFYSCLVFIHKHEYFDLIITSSSMILHSQFSSCFTFIFHFLPLKKKLIKSFSQKPLSRNIVRRDRHGRMHKSKGFKIKQTNASSAQCHACNVSRTPISISETLQDLESCGALH